MAFLPELGMWDVVLVSVVSVQATILAYVYRAKWKALVYTLPFTFAMLSLGSRVDASNVAGLILLLFFTHLVRFLYYKLRVPIMPAIVASAASYYGIAAALAPIVPRNEVFFWVAAVATFVFGVVVYRLSPDPAERGHRTPLPIAIKLPLIVLVVLFIVAIKQTLRGFMTVFQMVGVISAYEARHSLWTICRQIPVIMMGLIPMMAVVRLSQHAWGLIPALALGWAALLCILVPFTYATIRTEEVSMTNPTKE